MVNEKETENRTLVIRNFRNLGPFCVGTKKDDYKDKVFLKLNRSLVREELGGLVVLIGANNSGKSNVIDAIFLCKCKWFEEDDYTDFTYKEHVNPDIEMNVANGKYGVTEEGQAMLYEGKIRQILLGLMMEEETFEAFSRITESRAREGIRATKRTFSEYQNAIWNVYRSLSNGMDWIDSDFYKILEERQDYEDIYLEKLVDFDMGGGRDIDYQDIGLKALADGTVSFDDDSTNFTVITSSRPKDEYVYVKNSEYVKSCGHDLMQSSQEINSNIISELSHTSVRVLGPFYKPVEDELFENAYGYVFGNDVVKYDREPISQSDLVCSPTDLNDFFVNLLSAIGYSADAVSNAYGGAKTLRLKLEKDMNRELEKISNELNDLLNIREKKYSLSVKLERESIEFFITYGDDIPLNLDRQSEGFRWLFDFYFNLLKANCFEPGDIILMDEFGNSLGFSTIGELRDKMRDYGKKNGLTFVIATQNPMAVDIKHLDEVRLVVPEDDGSSRIINEFDHFGEEGDHDVMGPIINGLMVSRNFLRTENRRTVFVEGVTDYFYLNAFSEVLRNMGETVDIDFIPMNGLGRFKDGPDQVLEQIKAIEREPLLFIDSDKKGEQFKNAAKRVGINPSNLSEIFDGSKKEIEDLFSKKDLERFGLLSKSFDKAACFAYRLPEYYDSMDDETKGNFKKVIDYVMSQ